MFLKSNNSPVKPNIRNTVSRVNSNSNSNTSLNHSNSIPNLKSATIENNRKHLKYFENKQAKNNIFYNMKRNNSSGSGSTNTRSEFLNSQNDQTFNNNEKVIEEIVQNHLFNVSPGPGYYYGDEGNFSKTQRRVKSKLQCFGSTCERSMKLTNCQDDSQPGPGAYYNTALTIKKPSLFLFYRKENPDTYIPNKIRKEKEKSILGPGKYTIKSQFDKEKLDYSGPCQRRFNYTLKEENIIPGPGEYIQLKEWNQPKISIPLKQKNKQKDIIHQEFMTPGVGVYNPHILSSIGYKILSKENKFQSFMAPFNSAQDRFLKKSNSTSELLGPGCYNFAKSSFEKPINNQIIKETKPLQEYLESKNDMKGRLGPGSYGMFNYNQWNKKSFNILYA